MNNPIIMFAVCSENLDLPGEGVQINAYFRNERQAISHLDTLVTKYAGKERIEDLEGNLDSVRGKSLRYAPCYEKKAIYYLSHYGDYNCCYFINPIEVY